MKKFIGYELYRLMHFFFTIFIYFPFDCKYLYLYIDRNRYDAYAIES